MLHLLRHHLLLTWVVVFAAQYVVPFAQRVAKVRERQLDHLALTRYVQPQVGAIPQAVLTAVQSAAGEMPGFRQLGILTTEPSQSVYAFTGCLRGRGHELDARAGDVRADHVRVHAEGGLAVQTHVGDPANPRMIALSNGRSGGVVSGERPGVSGFAVPGADLATLLTLHRRQLLAEPEPRLSVHSLEQAAQVFEYLGAMQRSWWLSSGRLRRDHQGHLRFSWQQCLWWAARTGKFGRAVYLKRTLARTRKVEATWPQLPIAPAAVPVSSR